ncbi:LPS biosynthesis protein WbpP [Candidatus Beckwithbacteria bacterium CG10_big_fil_rev_8_21_14_0_10_34_10]|uniref:LPS biosynthesis protein WbpP n=1 Tax=Candidatus Beckwithbacteria bacterium CG10_big_fil_rev_8_21_14_0_10_34_10 TaxID=1974495 RepID=A0A2H0W992_9BACT|nr:MAG: LPS biosynthesis protein WbpP [Candidatus Beckwithbacteria bacterium CG10_big_fil_rev_8_21_14_0_10_34_10]
MSKCIVTGGAGFIGSHLARRLVNDGHQVIIIDNLCEGKLENIADIKDKIEFYKKDILNLPFLQKIFKNVDYVFHEAALRSVEKSVHKPLETNKVNIEGTLNVLVAARDNKVKRVIFASSSSVCGNQKTKVLTESLCPNPISPYALSKLTGEFYLKQFYNLYGLETISLRYFNVFGPYQDPANEYANVIPIFIVKVLKNKRPIIHWDGEQSRDFNYIDNVVKANILSMKAEKTKGEVVNVCNGEQFSVNQMLELINKVLNKNIKAEKGPKRAGDVRSTLGDPRLAEKVIGFRAITNFEEGLRKTISWFKNQH